MGTRLSAIEAELDAVQANVATVAYVDQKVLDARVTSVNGLGGGTLTSDIAVNGNIDAGIVQLYGQIDGGRLLQMSSHDTRFEFYVAYTGAQALDCAEACDLGLNAEVSGGNCLAGWQSTLAYTTSCGLAYQRLKCLCVRGRDEP